MVATEVIWIPCAGCGCALLLRVPVGWDLSKVRCKPCAERAREGIMRRDAGKELEFAMLLANARFDVEEEFDALRAESRNPQLSAFEEGYVAGMLAMEPVVRRLYTLLLDYAGSVGHPVPRPTNPQS